MSGQSSVRKMSCQVDVMSGKCVQEFEPEPKKTGAGEKFLSPEIAGKNF